MCSLRLPTTVQILCNVLVEDNFGITVHYLEFNVFCCFVLASYARLDCVSVLGCSGHDVGKFVCAGCVVQ